MQSDSLNKDLVTFILTPNFKLDTLLPNYLILEQLNISEQSSQPQIPQSKPVDIFDTIFNITKKILRSTIKQYINSVKKDRIPKKNFIQQQIEKNIDYEIKQWKDHPELNQIKSKVDKELKVESTIFLFSLTQVQDLYIVFLKHDFYYQLERINTYDDEVNLNWFSDILLKEVKDFIKQQMGTSTGLMIDLIIEQLNEEFLNLVHYMNELITTFYYDCRNYLTQAVKNFTSHSDNSRIMNKYLIIGLLHELSCRAYLIIENYLLYSIFVNSDMEVRECFAHFIIFNHDNLNLISLHEDMESSLLQLQIKANFQKKFINILDQIQDLKDENLEEQESENRAVEIILNEIINKNMKIQLHHVINKKTQKVGIHVQALSDSQHLQFIVHKPQDCVILTNAKLVPSLWSFIKPSLNKSQAQHHILDEKLEGQQEYQSIEHVFQEEHFKNQMIHIRKLDVTYHQNEKNVVNNSSVDFIQGSQGGGGGILVTSAAGDIGSSLGYCLANINKYSCKKAFLKDFGSTAAINGSITYLFLNMPLIGKLVAIGGFGYFAMKIYKNQSASKESKQGQFSKLLIGTGTGIGTSLGGALIGQSLIPIPIIGALIGGFLGGLVGGTSTAVIFEYMNEKKAKILVRDLERMQDQVEGCWSLEDKTISHLGLSAQFFMDQCPAQLKFDEQRELKWMNMVCYGFLCIFYTQKDELKQQERKLRRRKNQQSNGSAITSVANSTNDLDSQCSNLDKSIHVDNGEIDFDDEDTPQKKQEFDSDDEEDYHHQWPKSIDLSHKWLLKNQVIVLNGIENLENVIKSLISNL